MKKVILAAMLAACSASAFAELSKQESVYCVGQMEGGKGYASIAGAFSYDIWCSNGLYKSFSDYGCFTDSCQDQVRLSLEKNEIAALGFKFFKTTDLNSFQKKIHVYTTIENLSINPSDLDFAHSITRHTGFRTNPDRTTLFTSKSGKRAEIDLGAAGSSEYLDFLFKDRVLIKKISRDTPRRQLSEFYIYRR